MKIICDRDKFYEAVSGVSRAVSTKSSIPAVEGIMLRTQNNNLILTGYDLEIGITAKLDVDVREQGEIVINARLLNDIVRKSDCEEIEISADDKCRITIRAGISKYDFSGISAEDFPELPTPNTETALCINGSRFKNMIDKTIYAAAVTDEKPVHMGAKFFLDINKLTMVAVDGYRLAICSDSILNTEEKSFVVPAKTLGEVEKLIGDSDEDVYISTARRYAVFTLRGYTVVTRLLEGEFLDYKRAIPEGFKTRARVHVRDLQDAVERASLLITDRFRNPLRVKLENDRLSISCATSLGNAFDEFRADIEGADIEIGLNNQYILDALKRCGCEEVFVELGEATMPVKIRPVEGDEFLYLVLPIRIKV